MPLLQKAIEQLSQGDFRCFEQQLAAASSELHNQVATAFATVAAAAFSRSHQAPPGCKVRLRPHKVTIATGRQIELLSPYYQQTPCGYQGPRRPLAKHWGLIDGYSPLFYDRVGFMAMLAPSYDLATQGLNKFSVGCCVSTARKAVNALAEECARSGQENLIVRKGETLAGKRVVLSIDGGRTRTRRYTGQVNADGQAKFDTPWREPKLFVVDIIGPDGRVDRHELPIYGCQFSEEGLLSLLGDYLRKLEVQKAEHVQLVADGAPWIWNRVPALLAGLGVAEERLTLTLDYYHSSQYVHQLVGAMPKRVGRQERQSILRDFSMLLKEGDASPLVGRIRAAFKRPGKLVKRWLSYLERHASKMQYAEYKQHKLMCGSGIIESAVRRVINLRFKNASTFWLDKHVEHLYFLRGALVSQRWDIVMKNLLNR